MLKMFNEIKETMAQVVSIVGYIKNKNQGDVSSRIIAAVKETSKLQYDLQKTYLKNNRRCRNSMKKLTAHRTLDEFKRINMGGQ